MITHPYWFHAFTHREWARFVTSATTPATVSFSFKLPSGEMMYFDFGDGSPVIETPGVGAALVTQQHTYTTPGAGYVIRIWSSNINLLTLFYCHDNLLTGAIPSLAGLTALQYLYCYNNLLTGVIPSLAGLTALQRLSCHTNLLTGAIPSLAGLTALQHLFCYNNLLTGAIPSLAGLTALQLFYCQNNQLIGFDGGYFSSASPTNCLASTNNLSIAAVDLILADANAATVVAGSIINLSGGTNGIPTGGDSNPDVIALRADGVTVTINT